VEALQIVLYAWEIEWSLLFAENVHNNILMMDLINRVKYATQNALIVRKMLHFVLNAIQISCPLIVPYARIKPLMTE
jgi:hypothetical protein